MPQATENCTPSTRRSALRLSVSAAIAGLLTPVVAVGSMPSNDAELIRLCDEITRVGLTIRAICSIKGQTLEQEEAQEPELARLTNEEACLVETAFDYWPPTTMAGLRAMAKAAMAVTDDVDEEGSHVITAEHDSFEALTSLIAQAILTEEIVA